MRVLVAFLLLAIPAAAMAQQPPQCKPHDDVTRYLLEKYGESPDRRMLANDGRIIEMFTNSETETWTAVFIVPGGAACFLAAGTNYTPVQPAKKGKAS